MTSQTALKILSLISLLATISVIIAWRQSDELPSPWLIRIAGGALAAALVVFVVTPATRPRAMLQFLAALFATIAVFAFAADFTAGNTLQSTSLMATIEKFAPSLLTSLQSYVLQHAGPAVWEPILTSILSVPTYMFFGILAAFSSYAGRPRRQVKIFIN